MMQQEVEEVVRLLKEGKTILYPTDTVWGLGCDASNPEAVAKIFDVKQREDAKALIILIEDIGQLWDYVVNVPEIAWDMVEFAENPLTLVYPKGKNLAQNVMAEEGSIAIRLVKDEFCKQVIRKLRKPLVSTSANISGEVTPRFFNEVDEKIKSKVDYVVNWRREDKKTTSPSKIIKVGLQGEVQFLRK